MPETSVGTDTTLWWIAFAAVVIVALVFLFYWSKGRRIAGGHVFRASRFSRGNFLYPTQVAVTPTSIVHFTPQLVGGREHSIHMAHVSSVLIDRNLFFSDILIETSGGASPVRCHGHRVPAVRSAANRHTPAATRRMAATERSTSRSVVE